MLATGALVGIKPYLMLQWIVPIATEAPELVVAFVLLTHGRGGQSLAVLLAGAVSQYPFRSRDASGSSSSSRSACRSTQSHR